MIDFPQSLIDLRTTLEISRKNWAAHLATKPAEGTDVPDLVAWDIEDRQFERATLDARVAYDAALREFLAQDQPL